MSSRLFAPLLFLLSPAWAFAAVSHVGTCTPGTTSCTLPAHSIGDVVICAAFRDGSNTAPTVPTGDGYTSLVSGGGNSCSIVIGYLVADTTTEVSGTWTNASSTICGVYSGVLSIGGSSETGGSSATVTYPGVSPFTGATSYIFSSCGHRSVNTNLDTTAPAPLTFRQGVSDAVDDMNTADTAAAVSSFADTTQATGGTSSGFRCASAELVETMPAAATSFDPFGMSGFFGL